jgi:hypothetical protein
MGVCGLFTTNAREAQKSAVNYQDIIVSYEFSGMV